MERRHRYISPQTRKESYFKAIILPYDHFNFFPTEMVEKPSSVSYLQSNNVRSKLSASQYGFRAGVSTETALHEFVLRVEHCLI